MSRRNKRKGGLGGRKKVDLPSLSFRDVLQGSIGFSLYVFSWMFLTLLPLFTTVFDIELLVLLSSKSRLNIAYLLWLAKRHPIALPGFFTFVSLLVGFLLRWLARGVIEARIARTFVAAALSALLGWKALLVSLAGPRDEIMMLREGGIISIVTAIFLFWMVITGDHPSETRRFK